MAYVIEYAPDAIEHGCTIVEEAAQKVVIVAVGINDQEKLLIGGRQVES